MAVGIAMAVFVWAGKAQADLARDMVRCVQNQLTDLGADPGPADGSIGPRTRQAAQEVLQSHPLRSLLGDMPRLDRYAAVTWCRELPRLSRETGRHRPFLAEQVYAVEGDATGAQRDLLDRTVNNVTNFFRGRHGVQIISRLEIAAASDDATILRLLEQLPTRGPRMRESAVRWTKMACGRDRVITGFAMGNVLLFCWPGTERFDDAWSDSLALRLGRVMVHEMTHILQSELSHEILPQPGRSAHQSNRGPDWLVEGAAEVLADQYIGIRRGEPFARAFRFDLTNDTPLRDLHKNLSVATKRAYGVANLAVLVLARRHGYPALFEYWREIGRSRSTDTAFEHAFGITLAAYEKTFEALRDDPAALLAYADGEDAG